MNTQLFRAEHAQPIFISYARAGGGREFAAELREELESYGFQLWQDVIAMEGGENWWHQIQEAIEKSVVMVLVVNVAALHSKVVRDEWNYARQNGIPILPVTESSTIFADAPRWLSQNHIFNLSKHHADYDTQHTSFVKQLNNPAPRRPRPFTVPGLPTHFVQRAQQFDHLINILLDPTQTNPVAITTALQGGGGFGKTTLAIALCQDERIRSAFDDGILWIQFSEQTNRDDLLRLLNAQIRHLGGQGNHRELNDASNEFRVLLKDRNILLVLDDLWNDVYLTYFVFPRELAQKGNSAYVITTRQQLVVSRAKAERVVVDEMQTNEATRLLSNWLSATPQNTSELNTLARKLGEWALLLELVGAELRFLQEEGRTLEEAIDFVDKRLERRGFTYFDRRDEANRNLAITLSLDASVSRLKTEWQQRYYELGIFPEDVDIPFATVYQLWSASAGIEDIDAEDALEAMNRLSLFTRYDLASKTLRLHDVIRQVIAQRLANPVELHRKLVETWQDVYRLPNIYAWRNISYHYNAAQKNDELRRLLLDFRFITLKIENTDVNSQIADYDYLAQDRTSSLIQSALRLSGSSVASDLHLLPSQLVGRLLEYQNDPEIYQFLNTIKPAGNWFKPLRPSNIRAGSALIRRLQGRQIPVQALALFPNERHLAVGWGDGIITIWDWQTTLEVAELKSERNELVKLAISPDGKRLAAGYGNGEICVWNVDNRTLAYSIEAHAEGVTGLAFTPDGAQLISSSNDLKSWNATTGQINHVFEMPPEFEGVSFMELVNDEYIIAIVGEVHQIILWDLKSHRYYDTGESVDYSVYAFRVVNQGKVLLAGSRLRRPVRQWNLEQLPQLESSTFVETYKQHEVTSVAMTQDGTTLVAGCYDCSILLWNFKSIIATEDEEEDTWKTRGYKYRVLIPHSGEITDLSFTSDGHYLFSTSTDGTVLVWDLQGDFSSYLESLRINHDKAVHNIAVTPDNRYAIFTSGPSRRSGEMSAIYSARAKSFIYDLETLSLVKHLSAVTCKADGKVADNAFDFPRSNEVCHIRIMDQRQKELYFVTAQRFEQNLQASWEQTYLIRTADDDGSLIHLIEPTTGQRVASFQADTAITSVVSLPDKLLLCGDLSGNHIFLRLV